GWTSSTKTGSLLMSEDAGLRLQLFMARCGVASRRHCEKLITDGQVMVNGCVVTVLGSRVLATDSVKWRGQVLRLVQRKVYVALHKPVGILCSNRDDQGRPLAGDLLKGAVTTRVFHVGRLDFMSSGLVFYTNDGDLARIVTHPSNGVRKEYVIDTADDLPEDCLRQYQRGLRIGGDQYRLAGYRVLGPRRAQLMLQQGRNREIRRVMEHFGIQIRRLQRTRIGIVSLKGIAPGTFRFLRAKETEWFLSRKPVGPHRP
ncbi:hypothetical protein LCGC14_3141070, partial [marine sediment metagenome]